MAKDFSTLFPTETVEIMRSEIHPADYNPRKIDAEAKKALKRSIKKFGVVGGIVVNKQTGNTIVGGHQKVFILDEMNGYDKNTGEGDYQLKVELIDVDERTEKTLNVTLNNAAVSGSWDIDSLAALVPDIDWKDAGLTEADLSMIGLDELFKTEEQTKMSEELTQMMGGVQADHDAEVQARAQEREMIKQATKEAEQIAQQEKTREERIQEMKDLKQQVKEKAVEKAYDMNAYFILSFDNFKNKTDWAQKYGLDPMMRTIKGEDLAKTIESYYDDSLGGGDEGEDDDPF